jgi:translation initiation factor IF-3
LNTFNNRFRTRVNHHIRATEVRVIGAKGENLGVISTKEALEKAEMSGLDLIEISPTANPPVAKIMDYGKFQYEEKKKLKEKKAKAHTTEVKNVQIKIGTGEHDLKLKAKKVSSWLEEGNRVKIELYLRGRAKYLEKGFLEERLKRILDLITTDYAIADPAKKSPKGLTLIVERGKKTVNS